MENHNGHHCFASPLFGKALFAGSYPSLLSWMVSSALNAWAVVPFPAQNLMILMGIDLIVGALAARNCSKFDWIEFQRGCVRKLIILLVIGAAQRWAIPFHQASAFLMVVCGAFSTAELGSIVKGAQRGGISIPLKVLSMIDQMRKAIGSSERE